MDNKDLLLDDNFDLIIRDGDFVVGEATQQHIALLLISTPGDFKQHPLTGIGLINYLNSPLDYATKAKLYRQMAIQFEDNNITNVQIEGQLQNLNIR